MKLQSKFSKGDRVWGATVRYENNEIICPDCLGTLHWVVVFADGEAVEVACQTCSLGYEPPTGKINCKSFKSRTLKLTIGSVRYEDGEFSYMCEETGVGSGQVHKEKDLFLLEDEAEKLAQEQYQQQMRAVAKNNFSKKFGGTKEIEDALSTWGFSRSQAIEKVQRFKVWAGISGIVKKK